MTSLLDAVIGNDAAAPPRSRAARVALRHRGPDLRGGRAVDGRHRLRRALVRLFGKGVEGAHRAVRRRPRRARSTTGSRPTAGRALVPAQWRRRDDAEAVFLNQRGGRLSRQAAWMVVKKYGERAGIGDRSVAARAAPLVRDAPARPRRRPARRAGDARPRVDLDHPGVHPGQPGTAVGRLPVGPSAGGARGEQAAVRPRRPYHLAGGSSRRCRGPRRRTADEEWAESWLLPAEVALWRRMTEPRPAPLRAGRPATSSSAARRRRGRRSPAPCSTTSARSTSASASRVGSRRPPGRRPHRPAARATTTTSGSAPNCSPASGSDPVTVDLVAERGPAFPDLDAAATRPNSVLSARGRSLRLGRTDRGRRVRGGGRCGDG